MITARALGFLAMTFLALPIVHSKDMKSYPIFPKAQTFAQLLMLETKLVPLSDMGHKRLFRNGDHQILVHYGILGIPEKVEGLNKDEELLYKITIHSRGLTKEFFNDKKQVVKSEEWSGDEKSLLSMTTQIFLENGKGKYRETNLFKNNSKVFQYSECINTSGILPVDVDVRRLSRMMNHLFSEEETSVSEIQLRSRNCESAEGLIDEVRDAVTAGVRCMLSARRGGGDRSEMDIGLLIALMSNSSMPFTVQCFERGIPGHDAGVYAAASMCGESRTTVAPYPGINLDLSMIRTAGGDFHARTQGIIFHEMLHTLGYPHGHAPDISNLCETCCFGTFSRSVTDKACNLCRAGHAPGLNYLLDLIDYTSLPEAPFPNDATFMGILQMSRRELERGNTTFLTDAVNGLIARCTNGNFNLCPPAYTNFIMDLLQMQKVAADLHLYSAAALPAPLENLRQLIINSYSSPTISQAFEFSALVRTSFLRAGNFRQAVDYARTNGSAICARVRGVSPAAFMNDLAEIAGDSFAMIRSAPFHTDREIFQHVCPAHTR